MAMGENFFYNVLVFTNAIFIDSSKFEANKEIHLRQLLFSD